MLHKLKIIPKPLIQVLQNNELEKDVQRITQSFNFALNLFLSSKYYVKSNHIYPRGYKYLLLSFCYTLIMVVLCVYRVVTVDITDARMRRFDNVFLHCLSLCYFITYATYFTIMLILDLINNNNTVFLFLSIQTIYKCIDFSKRIQSFIIWNWISMFIIICTDMSIYIVFFVWFSEMSFHEIIVELICDIMIISFDVNYVITIRLIILLKNYLDEWIKNVTIVLNETQESNEKCVKLLGTYQNIMKAYNLYKTNFHVLVSSCICI